MDTHTYINTYVCVALYLFTVIQGIIGSQRDFFLLFNIKHPPHNQRVTKSSQTCVFRLGSWKAHGRYTRVNASGSERDVSQTLRSSRRLALGKRGGRTRTGGSELGREGDDGSTSKSASRIRRTRRPRALHRQHPHSFADRTVLRLRTQR